MSKSTSIEPDALTLAFQLYVELEWVQPKVWRRILVPITIDLPLLHATLLFGMGWLGGHLHEFVIGRDNYGPVDMAELDHILDEEGVTLRDALGARKTFTYVYDYGDVPAAVKLAAASEYQYLIPDYYASNYDTAGTASRRQVGPSRCWSTNWTIEINSSSRFSSGVPVSTMA